MTWLGFEGTPALKFSPTSHYSFFFLPAAGRGPRRLLGNHVSPYLMACWLLQHPRTGWQGHGRGSLATSGGEVCFWGLKKAHLAPAPHLFCRG